MFLDRVQPYGMSPEDKHGFLIAQLRELLNHHRTKCRPYARVVADWLSHAGTTLLKIEDYPFLPVTVFKEYELKSTDEQVLSLRSSATTSANASKVFVDRATKKRQSMSANKVLADFIGTDQRPYMVFDVESTVRGDQSLSARGAAILSLAHHATDIFFVMREHNGQLLLDAEAFHRALERIAGRPFVAYGFTYVLYQAHQEIQSLGLSIPPADSRSVLLHSGGWKRLTDIAVDKSTLSRCVASVWGLPDRAVIDFYGVIEQVGILYPDCSEGCKHVPYWADIIIRRTDTCEPAMPGEVGLIQLLNCLPLSAPNQSVLTEDLGEIVSMDGCRCGRRGKAFVFRGRAPQSELRGCSDVARN
jgi:hypothetical protein